MILEETSRITPASLPMTVGRGVPSSLSVPGPVSNALPEMGLSLEEHEKRLVVQALEKTGGNQTQAARLLQVTRDTLRYKMKKYGLH
jgi:DNA-binding NtrC family response regulator